MMSIWATHPRPQEGELLSSWLVRIAAECGMTVTDFCDAALPLKNRPNQRVVDRAPTDSLLQAISDGTGVSVDRIRESTLLTEEGYLFSQNGDGATKWIIPAISPQYAKRSSTGLAYCPECLRNDKKPYYRKLWRYAFYTTCSTHRILLRNACPHCRMPYGNIFPIAQKNVDLNNPLISCWSCGKNICHDTSSVQMDGDLLKHSLTIQENILSIVSHGAAIVPGHGYVYSRAYLNALHGALRTMTPNRDFHLRMTYVSNLIGLEYIQRQIKPSGLGYRDFEGSNAESRAIYLCLGNWLMGEWPTRFLAYAEQFGINLYALYLSKDTSNWISTTISLASKPIIGTYSSEEIANATKLLRQRLNRAVNDNELRLFMHSGTHIRSTEMKVAGRKATLEWHSKFSEDWMNEREAKRKKRLAKIITLSESKKFMEKINKDQKPAKKIPDADAEKDDPAV